MAKKLSGKEAIFVLKVANFEQAKGVRVVKPKKTYFRASVVFAPLVFFV